MNKSFLVICTSVLVLCGMLIGIDSASAADFGHISLGADGILRPGKSIPMQCFVSSEGVLPNEKVTLTMAKENGKVEQTNEMVMVGTEGEKRVYEFVVDPLPDGDYKFDCHVIFNSDEKELLQKKHHILYNVQDGPSKNTVDISRSSYVHVRPDRVIVSGISLNEGLRKKLIANIKKNNNGKFSDEDLSAKTVSELKALSDGSVVDHTTVGAPERVEIIKTVRGKDGKDNKEKSYITVTSRRQQVFPSVSLNIKADGKPHPNKPIKLRCTVESEVKLAGAKVIVIKEESGKPVSNEEPMNLAKTKRDKWDYEYDAGVLTPGDYKFTCIVNYDSDSINGLLSDNNKEDVSIVEKQEGSLKYNISLKKAVYVIVRDDEISTTGGNFESLEKEKLIYSILRENKGTYDFKSLVDKNIEELENIYGGQLTKYKSYGAARPK